MRKLMVKMMFTSIRLPNHLAFIIWLYFICTVKQYRKNYYKKKFTKLTVQSINRCATPAEYRLRKDKQRRSYGSVNVQRDIPNNSHKLRLPKFPNMFHVTQVLLLCLSCCYCSCFHEESVIADYWE